MRVTPPGYRTYRIIGLIVVIVWFPNRLALAALLYHGTQFALRFFPSCGPVRADGTKGPNFDFIRILEHMLAGHLETL